MPRTSDLLRRFYAPDDLDALRDAVAALDASGWPDAGEVWRWGGDRTVWSRLALPSPRPHPVATALWARRLGLDPAALRGLVAEQIWVDDKGGLVAWPWYPEEDDAARPEAEARAAAWGVAVPSRHLDAPYDPAWYLARSGPEALAALVRRSGGDPDDTRVVAVPVPPLRTMPDVRHEGGGKAPPETLQRLRALAVVDDDEVDARLARVCAAFGAVLPPVVPEPTALAPLDGSAGAPGRIDGLWCVDGGVVLSAGDAWRFVSDAGVAGPWQPGAVAFAARGGVFVDGDHLFDLAAGAWRSGPWEDHRALLGVELPPYRPWAFRGRSSRSDCGRYTNETDEDDIVVRAADATWVGPWPGTSRSRAPALLAPVAAGVVTTLRGVVFTVRRTTSAVVERADARAFVLDPDEEWVWFDAGVFGVGRKARARLGPVAHQVAFDLAGARWWALLDAHLVRGRRTGDTFAVDAVLPLPEAT
jgi:hypothetical protein